MVVKRPTYEHRNSPVVPINRERAARGLARQPSQYSNRHQPLPGVRVEEAAKSQTSNPPVCSKKERAVQNREGNSPQRQVPLNHETALQRVALLGRNGEKHKTKIHQTNRLGPTITAIAGRPHGGMMLGGTLSFFGPSTLLSTILRASAKTCAGVGSGGVLASRNPSSS